jgi:hypothetical protein
VSGTEEGEGLEGIEIVAFGFRWFQVWPPRTGSVDSDDALIGTPPANHMHVPASLISIKGTTVASDKVGFPSRYAI